MGLQFIIGSSGAGKSHFLYKSVIQQSIKEPDQKFFVIVPEQFTLQTQRDFVSMHPSHGIMNIDVLSFMRLAYHVFDEVGQMHRLVLEDTGKSMVVKKVAMEKRKDLVLFGANVRKQGFIDEMKSVISELLQYSIHSEELLKMQDAAQNKKLLSGKLKDIALIYEGYEDFLKDRYLSAEELLDVLAGVIAESKLLKDSVICFDGFTGFTPSQYKLMSYMLKQAKTVYVTVTMDAREAKKYLKEHELFHLSSKTMEKLTRMCDESGVEVLKPVIFSGTPYRFRMSKELEALEHNLFRYPYRVYDKPTKDITLMAAKNPQEETANVVVTIKELLQKEGYRYKDIAVVTGDISLYEEELRTKFEEANIPCFIDHKKNIIANPVVEMIRAAIELAEQNFSYDSVMRFLKCSLTGYEKEKINALDNYVLALGIRGRFMYEREWKRPYQTKHVLEIEEINELREQLFTDTTPFFTVLTDKNATVKARITALYEMLVFYEAEQKLSACADAFLAYGDKERQRAKEYQQVFKLVLEVFDRMAELLSDDILTLKEFKDILETGLREAKVGLIPPGVDQILVGDIERTRLKDIKALFFIGVNDGIVPKANQGGGILSDADRQLFADHDIELSPTKRQTAYLTEFYLYLNLTKPMNKLYLSFSKSDGSGKAIRASYLIAKIHKLFPQLTIISTDRKENVDITSILAADRGLSYLISNLREYDPEKEMTVFYELYRMYVLSEVPSKLSMDKLLDAAFYQNQESMLSKEAAHALYGETLLGSVTRLEQYAACAFAHFLEFGLCIEERKEFRISVPDIGNIFHEALELFSKKLKDSKYSWHDIPKEEEVRLGKESVREAVEDYGGGVLESSKRNAYLVTRVERILLKTLEMLTGQLKKGKFEPEKYEQYFAHADRYLKLHGRIDRMDVFEEENKVYVKVIDYKSGSTTFDLMRLYYGLQLQLGVYLSAALSLLKEENSAKTVIPAGVFYYNLEDPIVEKSDHVKEEIEKKLRMNGLVNADPSVIINMDDSFYSPEGGLSASVKSTVIPVETSKDGSLSKRSSTASLEQFIKLEKYITNLMHEFSVQIMNGVVCHNPYKDTAKVACDICRFKAVCGFDCKIDGYEYRRIKNLSAQEAMQLIEKGGEEDGGKEMDSRTAEGN